MLFPKFVRIDIKPQMENIFSIILFCGCLWKLLSQNLPKQIHIVHSD